LPHDGRRRLITRGLDPKDDARAALCLRCLIRSRVVALVPHLMSLLQDPRCGRLLEEHMLRTADNPREAATEVVRVLREHGHQALFVGGCVRDLLLGREPEDYDVATDATPQQVMQIFPRTFAVGAQFGVVLVAFDSPTEEDAQHEICVEVATFRSDIGYSDGRHPDQVRFSRSVREDVERRDFTINGMLLDPLKRPIEAPLKRPIEDPLKRGGDDAVIDYVGGRDDLAHGIIRTIGDPMQRFAEDKLRMLRAIRFAARFGYDIDAATFTAVRQCAANIHQVSCERIRDELLKMLTEGSARRAFELLDASGLLAEVLPEVAAMKGVEQPPQFHPEGDVWTHTLIMLCELPAGCSKTLALGVLLHDVGKPPTFERAPDRIRFNRHAEVGAAMAARICRRLRLSNDDTAQVLALVANHMRFADVMKMKQSTLKRFLRMDRFDEHLALHRIDCRSSHGGLELYHFAKKKFEEIPEDEIRPAPLITGSDLIAAGYSPGPRFKDMLSLVEDAQLEGVISDRDAALALVRSHFGPA
jgi:poly(A) polymerase